MRANVLGLLALIFGFIACREPFDPEIPQQLTSVLVVEGYLDTEGLESELRISRTVPLDAKATFAPESGASVNLFSESGTTFSMTEKVPGVYVIARDLPENANYRLEIVLRGGERFESTLIRPIITPDIIDAGFIRDQEGVEVYVNTQGNEAADDFLWTYEETWIFRPRIRTNYIYDPATRNVRDRTQAEQISLSLKASKTPIFCWRQVQGFKIRWFSEKL